MLAPILFALLSADEAANLRGAWVTDSDLPALTRQAGLKRIDLSMTRISDQGLLQLKGLTGIEELNLRFAELITDEGMSAVKTWKQLKRIDLRATKITDTTLGYLGGLPNLESVDVGFAQVTDNGIELLTTLPKLKHLMMGGNKLTDTGLQALRLMPTLESLDISGPQRTDSGLWSVSLTAKGIGAIASLSNLKELRIGGTSITAAGLEELRKGLPKLERLSLHRAKRIEDPAIEVLKNWPSLKEVDLKDTKVSEAALKALPSSLIVRN
jgi:Leucine-rich repeat (LRR) protein